MKKTMKMTLGLICLTGMVQACGDNVAEPQDNLKPEAQHTAPAEEISVDVTDLAPVVKQAPIELEQSDVAMVEEQASKMPSVVIARIKADGHGNIAPDAQEEIRYVYDVSEIKEVELPNAFSAASNDPYKKVEKEEVASTAFLNTYNYAPGYGQYSMGHAYGGAISPYMGNGILPQFGMNQFGGMFDFDDYYDDFGYGNYNNYGYLNQSSYFAPWNSWNGGLQYNSYNQWQNAVSYIPAPSLGYGLYGNSYLNNSLVYPYSNMGSYYNNGYLYSSRMPMWY